MNAAKRNSSGNIGSNSRGSTPKNPMTLGMNAGSMM